MLGPSPDVMLRIFRDVWSLRLPDKSARAYAQTRQSLSNSQPATAYGIRLPLTLTHFIPERG